MSRTSPAHIVRAQKNEYIRSAFRVMLAAMLASALMLPAYALQAHADEGAVPMNGISTANVEGDGDAGDAIRNVLTEQSDRELAGNVQTDDSSVVNQLMQAIGMKAPASADGLDATGLALLVKYTIADEAMLDGAGTIDGMMADPDKAMALAGQFGAYAPLYELGAGSDYYVAYVDSPSMNGVGEISDYAFALNDADGNVVEEAVYDEDAGIAYVPKSRYAGADMDAPVQLQVLVPIDIARAAAETPAVAVRVNGGGVVDVPEDVSVKEGSLALTTTVQVATVDTAGEISIEDIEVKLNGSEDPIELNEDNASYDAETGELSLAVNPMTVTAMDVKVERGFSLTEKAHAAVNTTGNWFLRNPSGEKIVLRNLDLDSLSAGSLFKTTNARIGYVGQGHAADQTIISQTKSYLYSWSLYPETLYEKIAYHNDSWNSYNVEGTPSSPNTLTVSNNMEWVTHTVPVPSGTVGGQDWTGFSPLSGLALTCGHVTNPIGTIPTTTDTYGNVWWRVLDMSASADEPYVILGFVCDSFAAQGGVGIYKVGIEPNGKAQILKESSNAPISNGNGLYSLEGAVYGVYTSTADANNDRNRVATLTTDATGKSNAADIRAGSYYYKEVTAPAGYKKDTDIHNLTITAGETNSLSVADVPVSDPGEITVKKYDPDMSMTTTDGQGAATLEGAQFTYRFYAGGYYDDASLPGSPTRTWVLNTNRNGLCKLEDGDQLKVSGDDFYYNENGVIVVPIGTLTVVETKAPEGYLLGYEDETGAFHEPERYIIHFKQSGDGVQKDLASPGGASTTETLNTYLKDTVIRGGLKVGKADREYGDYAEQGAAKLSGAKFEIVNKSSKPVVVDGRVCAPNAVAKTITSEYDETSGAFIARTENDTLPYGDYLVRESTSPEGYLYDAESSTWSKSFSIRVNGEVVDYSSKATACANLVKRGDFSFYKVRDDTSRPMAGVAWTIASNTTGEEHVVVTDENGYVNTSSEWSSHKAKTNANDAALNPDGTVDETKLDDTAGLWFNGTSDMTVAADDGRGALPYDTYTVTELSSAANEGANLKSFTVKITRDNYVLAAPTVRDDYVMVSTSLATDAGQKLVPEGREVGLVDTYSYMNLEDGGTYEIKGAVHLVDADGTDLGEVATREVTFTAHGAPVDVEVPFTVSTEGLAGKKLVAVGLIYDSAGELVVEHDDLADENQTVGIASIGTTFADGGGAKVVHGPGLVTLVDTVEYHNLIPLRHYTAKASLHRRAADGSDAGNVFEGTEQEVVAVSFEPEQSDGTVEVAFEIDAEAAYGTLVAFEEVYLAGEVVAEHTDISDEGQTVRVPGITTLAHDSGTATHTGSVDGHIVDVASYEGFEAGKTYIVTGAVHLRASDGTDGGAIEGLEKSVEFKATESGTVAIEFDQAAIDLAGNTVVVFERATDKDTGEVVAVHEDIASDEQAVRYPAIRTTAHIKDGSGKTLFAGEGTQLTDTVAYVNFSEGSYDVSGTVHALNDEGADLGVLSMGKGNPVVGTASFDVQAGKAKSGSADVEYTFDTTGLAGKRFVVFEEVAEHETGAVVARHADAADAAQTVSVAGITTVAVDARSGERTATTQESPKVKDTASYVGFAPGEKFTMKGELVDHETGNAVKLSKQAVAEFTPEKSSGDATIELDVDKSVDVDGRTYVAFEEVYDSDGNKVAEHKDIDYANQTVAYRTAPTATSFAKTGALGIVPIWIWPILAAIVAIITWGVKTLIEDHRRYWPAER